MKLPIGFVPFNNPLYGHLVDAGGTVICRNISAANAAVIVAAVNGRDFPGKEVEDLIDEILSEDGLI